MNFAFETTHNYKCFIKVLLHKHYRLMLYWEAKSPQQLFSGQFMDSYILNVQKM